MIPAETQYETYNGKLLAIIKAFKTWLYYLEDCQYKMLVFTDHNNLYCFMDTKSMSSRQVCWAQKLSQYHFQIHYRQGKVNAAINTLSKFLHKSQNEKNELQAENGRIFYCFQISLTNACFARLSFPFSLPSQLHQILIYGIYVLPQLHHF